MKVKGPDQQNYERKRIEKKRFKKVNAPCFANTRKYVYFPAMCLRTCSCGNTKNEGNCIEGQNFEVQDLSKKDSSIKILKSFIVHVFGSPIKSHL